MVSSGALSFIRQSAGATATGSNGSADLYFDASRSNAIYTDNGAVSSLSLTLNYVIKI